METSQELRMLSSVTLNCQVKKIVMTSGSQLSEIQPVSQMSKSLGSLLEGALLMYLSLSLSFFGQVMSP